MTVTKTASDNFQGGGVLASDPAPRAFAITGSDTAELPVVTRGIHVGAGGNIAVVFEGDFASTPAPVTLAVLAGVVYPYRIRQVMATNTTATGLVGVY